MHETAQKVVPLQTVQQRRISTAFPPGSPAYDCGYRDALQSVAMALSLTGVPHEKVTAAITTAIDAFGNNAT